jgi:hypothetical protein
MMENSTALILHIKGIKELSTDVTSQVTITITCYSLIHQPSTNYIDIHSMFNA